MSLRSIRIVRKKRKNLESLSNEVLLDLFEFLPIVHLLRGFHNLNAGFNTLLFTHFRVHGHLDFRSVSKRDFDIVCRQHLPFVVDRIISVRLSNDDNTPQQSNLFFSRGFTLYQFTQLQSLSLFHLDLNETIIQMFDKLYHLSNLDLIKCYFRNNEHENYKNIINIIWNLPKLTRCHLGIFLPGYGPSFPMLEMISSSLEYLHIEHHQFDLNALDNLFRHTPHLQYLQASLINACVDQQLSSPGPLSMNTLKISDVSFLHPLLNLLQNMPNLCHLTVKTSLKDLNGHRWEQIITDHLPKLKVFQLKMQLTYFDNYYREQKLDQLIESFRSSFWLDKHQWFVRSHWGPASESNVLWLYTLPYAFADFSTIAENTLCKSTCPHENDHWSYNRVHNFKYESFRTEEWSLSHIRFPNIRHLFLEFPTKDDFWTVIPTLDQLTSLEVTLNDVFDDTIQFQLQILLDRAPHIYSFKFRAWPTLVVSLVESRTRTIRRLDLLGFDLSYREIWLHDEECAELCRSQLIIQCEVLLIRVEHRKSILNLIDRMIHLRALHVLCLDDKFNGSDDRLWSKEEEQLDEWLKNRLPSTWKIARDPHSPGCIQMWIRKKKKQ